MIELNEYEPAPTLNTTSAMVGPLRSGFPPLATVLVRKTRPANGLWAKPGNSQGSSLRSLALTRCGLLFIAHCGRSLRGPEAPLRSRPRATG
jgi:hypothetical protein